MNKPGNPPPPPRRPNCIVTKPTTPRGMPSLQCFKGPIPKQVVAFVAPVARMGTPLSSPTSGPASGLWASNNPVPTPPAPTPTPTPPPAPSCVTASIFTDCFPCTGGPINGGSPGPACGWTFSQAFGPKGGSVSFTPGLMTMLTGAVNEVPAATKPIVLPAVTNVTMRWNFNEYPAPTGFGFSFYEFYALTAGPTDGIKIRLVDDGSLQVSVGSLATAGFYTGSWVPNNGSHEVHITVDGSGVPTLYIDGVLVALTFLGNFGIFTGSMPGSVVATFMSSGTVAPDSAGVTSVFLTAGILPPTTEFCCS